jgi:polysaccharide export outer membrane protein
MSQLVRFGRCVAPAAAILCLALTVPGCGNMFIRVDPATAAYVDSLTEDPLGTNILTEYQVGPEDVLDIRVWGDDTLSKVVAVRPDGKISLPLIGDVLVAGKSAPEIAAEVKQAVARYKASPQVDVSIAQINSYRIYLLGEVQHPGMVQVRNFTTLLQAIALAGGPTPFASDDIVVLRTDRDTGKEHVLRLNYRLLSSDREEHRPFNLVLWPGDTVILK